MHVTSGDFTPSTLRLWQPELQLRLRQPNSMINITIHLQQPDKFLDIFNEPSLYEPGSTAMVSPSVA